MNEKELKSIKKCREIINEIKNFGINEFETLQLIKLLTLELEDIVLMKEINSVIENNEKNNNLDINTKNKQNIIHV